MYPNVDIPYSEKDLMNYKLLLEVGQVDIYSIKHHQLELITTGILRIVSFELPIAMVCLCVNDFRYTLSKDIPVAKRDEFTQYVLPHADGFFGLVLKTISSTDFAKAFEAILFQSCEYFSFVYVKKEEESVFTEKEVLQRAKVELQEIDPDFRDNIITKELIQGSSTVKTHVPLYETSSDLLEVNQFLRDERNLGLEATNENSNMTTAQKIKSTAMRMGDAMKEGVFNLALKAQMGANYVKKLIKSKGVEQGETIIFECLRLNQSNSIPILEFTKEELHTLSSFSKGVVQGMHDHLIGLSNKKKIYTPEQVQFEKLRLQSTSIGDLLHELIEAFEEPIIVLQKSIGGQSAQVLNQKYETKDLNVLKESLDFDMIKRTGRIGREYEKSTFRAAAEITAKTFHPGVIAEKKRVFGAL